MTRRWYLHIGTMKSGTTYIQELWELNREQLAGSNLLWPTVDRYHAVRDFFGRDFEGTDITGTWQALVDEVNAHDGDFILSNELLAALPRPRLKKLLAAFPDHEVHLIITARDLARVIPSHWEMSVKNGNTHSWPEFAAAVCAEPDAGEKVATAVSASDSETTPGQETATAEDRFEPELVGPRFWQAHDVARLIRKWLALVPAERITVVTLPQSGDHEGGDGESGGDDDSLARRFGDAVGVSLVGLEQPSGTSNASVGSHSSELLRRLNDKMADVDKTQRRDGFRIALGRSVLPGRAGLEPSIALTEAQQEWVVQRAREMVAEIELTGVHVEGSLKDLIPPERPASVNVDPADTSETDLLAAAMDGLVGMVTQVAAVVAERDALQAELAAERAAVSAELAEFEARLVKRRQGRDH